MVSSEVIAYMGVAFLCYMIGRVDHGLKNGIIYSYGNRTDHSFIMFFRENLHRLETLGWYWRIAPLFFFLLAGCRMEGHEVGLSILYASCLSLSASGMAGPFRQGMINIGSGARFTDDDPAPGEGERPEQEIAIGRWSKWIKRPFGKWRWVVAAIWVISFFVFGYLAFVK